MTNAQIEKIKSFIDNLNEVVENKDRHTTDQGCVLEFIATDVKKTGRELIQDHKHEKALYYGRPDPCDFDFDGTSGQDRKSYSDDQDRENYTA